MSKAKIPKRNLFFFNRKNKEVKEGRLNPSNQR
jgi:hypothetical protein